MWNDITDQPIFEYIIEQAPTADVAPVKHGKWAKANNREKSYLYNCSACGKTAYFCGVKCDYNYCPNCGAKMDGGKG